MNVLLRAYLDEALDDSCGERRLPAATTHETARWASAGDPWAACAWRRVCRAVAHAEAEREAEGAPARADEDDGSDDADASAKRTQVATGRQRIDDTALARWLERTIQWNEQSSSAGRTPRRAHDCARAGGAAAPLGVFRDLGA